MRYKTRSSSDKLLEELVDRYGEWLEMGHPFDEILLNLLEKEREKNIDCMTRIKYLEDKLR